MEAQKNQKRGLTKRQREYLDWIKNYITENEGQSPSYEEIGVAMGTSISAAQRIVSDIVHRGHLITLKGSQRSLAIPEA